MAYKNERAIIHIFKFTLRFSVRIKERDKDLSQLFSITIIIVF